MTCTVELDVDPKIQAENRKVSWPKSCYKNDKNKETRIRYGKEEFKETSIVIMKATEKGIFGPFLYF